jgi:phosphoribosylaminoimidazolecarboxamide formyltransferase / IMP cyclohydrolase
MENMNDNKNDLVKIRRALISVSDKSGIVEFTRALKRFGVEIISTGGTAKTLRDNGIEVRDVSEVTGFPEMMDGRVKTLHPKIHGALLGLHDNLLHRAAMREHGIEPIDLLIVNLYPFEQTISKPKVTLNQAIENIDIGGPALIRSAAKNWRNVAVVLMPELYDRIVEELVRKKGSLTLSTRAHLARLAFMRTAIYDSAITAYLSDKVDDPTVDNIAFELAAAAMTDQMAAVLQSLEIDLEDEDSVPFPADLELTETDDSDESENFPEYCSLDLVKVCDLRYGENPHQQAALYESDDDELGITNAELLQGKEMSFNNYVDSDAAWNLVCEIDETACAIIKHTNPCGVAIGGTIAEAYRRALATDPVSGFGGIVAFNREVDGAAAKAVTEIFTEVVVAPSYDDEALEILETRKNLRVLCVDECRSPGLEYRTISGGVLVQTRDTYKLGRRELKTVTKRKPTKDEVKALLFAWTICKHTKSNAIVYARDGQTVGVGAGQMSRVDSVKIGAMRAHLPLAGSVLASDAFFPFRDGIDEAAKHGITAVGQPGGSKRDSEVIGAANEHNLAMVFTGIRHFKH